VGAHASLGDNDMGAEGLKRVVAGLAHCPKLQNVEYVCPSVWPHKECM
jgi:hypothetical protein